MKNLIIFLFALCANSAHARVDELSLELRQMKHKRHAYYPFERDLTKYVGLNWDISKDLYQNTRMYWDNTTYFYGSNDKVEHIGWQFEVGINITDHVSIIYHHHSEHSADRKSITGDRFPLEDSFGIRIDFTDSD